MTSIRDELLSRAVDAFEREGATAVHIFGSLARGDGDALSDIDLWITVPDDEIEQITDRRLAAFNDIAEVVIHHEAPRNRPLGGSYTLVIHRVGDALIQTDYYLAPESTSVILPEARHLSGKRSLPRGQWLLDTSAEVTEDLHERIDFLTCMSFIGIKKVLRGDHDFLAFLDREYDRFRTTWDPQVNFAAPTTDLGSLSEQLRSLFPRANDRQAAAIQAVLNDVRRQSNE
ncbi:hypothetical protein BH23CHL2_BH23CHL2_04580 [soil metagenome]